MAKDYSSKSARIKLIGDTISGALLLLSVLIYVILGVTISWWHPGWIIIAATAIADGIISLVVNLIGTLKYPEENANKNQNINENN